MVPYMALLLENQSQVSQRCSVPSSPTRTRATERSDNEPESEVITSGRARWIRARGDGDNGMEFTEQTRDGVSRIRGIDLGGHWALFS